MRLHAPSLVAGGALVALVGLLSAQNLVNSPQLDVRIVDPRLDRDQRTSVVVQEGTPYTVPFGRLLVISALGSSVVIDRPCTASVNGATVAEARAWYNGGPSQVANVSSMVQLPYPYTFAPAGATVEVFGGAIGLPDDARIWGYLIDE